jgi:hypothetical protein
MFKPLQYRKKLIRKWRKIFCASPANAEKNVDFLM